MNIEHISISRKSVWEQCPFLYKLKYHLKTKSPLPEPEYFAYGKIVHRIAEEYCNHKGKVLMDEICRDVLNGTIEVEEYGGKKTTAKPLSLEYRRRLPDELRALQRLFNQIGTEGRTEYDFEFDLDPPHGRKLVGFIDFLIEEGGLFWIIDYKTTKQGPWRKDDISILEDLQLRAYAKVVQRNFKAPANKIHAALYYVQGGDLVPAQFTQKSIDEAERDLLAAYKAIEDTSPEQAYPRPADHCKRCDYRTVCPHARR